MLNTDDECISVDVIQVGTVVTNAFINARRAADKSSSAEEVDNNVPILSTAAAYGVYMSISSNLR